MKILVVRLSSLGDILHFFPAVTDLQSDFPDAEIHWLVEPAFAELASWHDAVKKVIPIPLRAHKKTWWKVPRLLKDLRKTLQNEHYDWVLDAQGLLKSAVLAKLTGAPVFGFAADSAREPLASKLYQRQISIPTGLHIIEKNRQLVAGLSQKHRDTQANTADFGLTQFKKNQIAATQNKPYIVLLHGTTWQSKYWSEASWYELIGLLTKQGWTCMLPWGNQSELERAQRLQQSGGELAQVLPKCNLQQLSQILLGAHAFVAVETGIGHLAALLDIKGVMLHGPTDPNYSGILGKACQHLTSGLECSPCFKRNCPKVSTHTLPPCQAALTPQDVAKALTKI